MSRQGSSGEGRVASVDIWRGVCSTLRCVASSSRTLRIGTGQCSMLACNISLLACSAACTACAASRTLLDQGGSLVFKLLCEAREVSRPLDGDVLGIL